MRTRYIFSFLLLLISSSCVIDKNPVSSTNNKIIFSSEYFQNFDFILDFRGTYTIGHIKKDIDSTKLYINNKLLFSDINIKTTPSTPYFFYEYLDSVDVDSNDESFEFSWQNNLSKFLGSMEIPSKINMEFSEYIDGNDYRLDWYTNKNPDAFLVKLQIQDSLSNNLLIKDWQLSGEQRSFSISSKYFDFAHKYLIFISLVEYNYIECNDCLAIIHFSKMEVFKL